MLTQRPPVPRTANARTATKRRVRRPLSRGRILAMVSTLVVVALVAVVAVGAVRSHNQASGASGGSSGSGTSLLHDITNVTPSVLAAVGTGGSSDHFTKLTGASPLTGAGGKPLVLYVGAESCPYCAAQRWSLVVALSRFGSFNDLALTASSSTEVFPETTSVSFHGAVFTSTYIDFTGVETADRYGKALQPLTAQQQQLLTTYDAPPYVSSQNTGVIPWLDVANRSTMVGSGYTPQVLAGLSWLQISDRVTNAGDVVAKAILGNANRITAAICKSTGMQPATVCQSAPIAAIAAQMP